MAAMDAVARARQRQQVLQSHAVSLSGLERMLQQHAPLMQFVIAVSRTNTSNVKPYGEFAVAPPLEACTPIGAASLAVNTTHKGRVLRGKTITQAYIAVGLSTILEDENGDVVKVRSTLLGMPPFRRCSTERPCACDD